jgi:hypothetical protein
MANTKISALTSATTPLAGTETLPIVQSNATVKVAVSNLTAGRAVSAASLTLTTTPLPVTSGGTGVTTSTGTGNTVLSAAPTLSGNVTLSTGNLVIGTAGKGIDFSADPAAAGMTSELLDDYEEGTWTPVPTSLTVVGTPTYGGQYTKIGNLVTIKLTASATTSLASTAGTTFFAGLPYFNTVSSCPFSNISTTANIGVGASYSVNINCPTFSSGANQTVVSTFSYFI